MKRAIVACYFVLSIFVASYFAAVPFAKCAQVATERPVNFIFLLDVSGSMLYKSEMVKAADGSQVTLFEGLREALKQIASDERLIGSQSKVSVITFGTAITEKATWPTSLKTPEDRQKLIQLISSPEELQADKHGDTYMGGALHAAYDKAIQMQGDGDTCATTFIIMLTDGWDEPPSKAQFKVSDVSKQVVSKKRELRNTLGFDTWQIRVIGLQHLPDRKAGTTTAKELADNLSGQFIDVSAQQTGTVSERIFLALKQTVDEQKGKLVFPNNFSSIDFGKTNNEGVAIASIPVRLDSCYAEDVTGIVEDTESEKKRNGAKSTTPSLPEGALTFSLSQPTVTLSPNKPGKGANADHVDELTVEAHAHRTCPAGEFSGVLRLVSSAKIDRSLPYKIIVPGRLLLTPEEISVEVKKPGFLFPEPSQVLLKFSLEEAKGSHARANLGITATAEPPVIKTAGESKEQNMIALACINDGKPVSTEWNTNEKQSADFSLPVDIPAKQVPGKYVGKIDLKVDGLKELVAPASIAFAITINPSAWEVVAPIAIPLFLAVVFVVGFGLFLWVSSMKRES
jgi:Mg-chelatase subunit ChlD